MIYILKKSGERVILRHLLAREEKEKFNELTSKFCDKNIRAIVADTNEGTRTILCEDIKEIVRT